MAKKTRKRPQTIAGIVGTLLIALLCYFIQGKNGAKPSNTPKSSAPSPAAVEEVLASPAPAAPATEVSKPQGKASHRAHWHQSNLQRHWDKHCAEFPEYHSAKEYGEATVEFVNNPPEGTLRKTTAEGDQMYYHPPSNRFAVTTADGTIKTCFKPDQGIRYWERQ